MAALDWLEAAFGFRLLRSIQDPDGRLTQAEMDVGDGGLIMLPTPTPVYEGPRRHREHLPGRPVPV